MNRKRNIGIEEATHFYLEQIEKYDRKLNTISEINELALKQAIELDSWGVMNFSRSEYARYHYL